MRNRALIAHWVLENGNGVVELVKKNDKTYLQINDYARLRNCFAHLLAEIQRIKSESDYVAAQQLVEKYAINIDPELHDEMIQRYNTLDIAPYKGFINPRYTLEKDANGNIVDVKIDYTEGYAEQMLRYSRDYSTLL